MERDLRGLGRMYDEFSYARDNADLPKAERVLAEEIGRSAAMRLSWRVLHRKCHRVTQSGGAVVDRFGDLYVPKLCTADFVERVGDEDVARRLVAKFGGEQFQLTGCRAAFKRLRTHMVRWLYRNGVDRARLVQASRLTGRQVRRLCSGETTNLSTNEDDVRLHLAELSWLSFFLAADPV